MIQPRTQSESNTQSWGRFWARLALFAVPLVAVMAFAVFVLEHTGELPCAEIPRFVRLQQQSAAPLIYGPAYSDCTAYLKVESLAVVHPRILSLGTSRGMQLRAEFFRESFYNGSNITVRSDELSAFLDRLPESAQPQTLVLVLDQFLLNEATDINDARAYGPFDLRVDSCVSPARLFTETVPKVYRDILSRKLTPRVLSHPPYPNGFGLRARTLGAGYRPDGSLEIGLNGAASFDEVLDRMARGVRRYEFGSEVSPRLVAAIERFLSIADRRGIHVIAILPPYAPSILDRMNELGRWQYVPKVYPALAPRFAAHGFELYDFGDVRALGFTDDEFYDGFHGSERVFGGILVEIARRSSKMASLVDVGQLNAWAARSQDRLAIVPTASEFHRRVSSSSH